MNKDKSNALYIIMKTYILKRKDRTRIRDWFGTVKAQSPTYYVKAVARSASGISISKGVCTLQAQSLTYCEKGMAGSASARRSALCKHNHLLPVRR